MSLDAFQIHPVQHTVLDFNSHSACFLASGIFFPETGRRLEGCKIMGLDKSLDATSHDWHPL
jgi:hypothetical protein